MKVDRRTPRSALVFTYNRSYFPTGTTSGAPLLNTTVKTGFALGYRGGLVHRPARTVAALSDDGLIYASKWLCGGASSEVRPIHEKDITADARCIKCDDAALGSAVYRFFDQNDQLLYIGSAERFVVRRAAHVLTSTWWRDVAREEVERFATIDTARLAEVAAIRAEHPKYNRIHRSTAVAR